MNFSQFHDLCVEETDYRPHFTCGGILYFLKHNHTAQWVNTVRKSVNCVCALPQNQQTQHTCTIVTAALQFQHSQTEFNFWVTLVYGKVRLAHSSILTVCDNAGGIKERAWYEKEVFV